MTCYLHRVSASRLTVSFIDANTSPPGATVQPRA